MKPNLSIIKPGLLFGISMGIGFGINENFFKNYIAQGIADNQLLHDSNSQGKIWRYAQRAHFQSTGIAAFSSCLVKK